MIHIATDGSCIQQGDFRQGDDTPRPGAYAMIAVHDDGMRTQRACPEANGLIGRMEASGLLLALEYVRDLPEAIHGEAVLIQCDSQYAVNSYNEWMIAWQANGWRKKKGTIANLDVWQKAWDVRQALAGRNVRVEWVKAHQNVGSLNDAVDALANECAHTQKAVSRQTDALGSIIEAFAANPPRIFETTRPADTAEGLMAALIALDDQGADLPGAVRDIVGRARAIAPGRR